MKFNIDQNINLLEALALAFPDSSKSNLRSWIKVGRILVDDVVVKIASTPLHPGQTVTVSSKEVPIEGKLKILFEDQHLVVIDKPAGLLSVSTAFQETATAHAILKRKYHPKRVYVAHRLDQDTSGVMLFALTEEALEKLKKIFEAHQIERRYTALVEGHLEEEVGTWRSYLVEDPNYVVHETFDTVKGELAITHYSVLGKSKYHSWLSVELETGKKIKSAFIAKAPELPSWETKNMDPKAILSRDLLCTLIF